MTRGRDTGALVQLVAAILVGAISAYLTVAHYGAAPLACVNAGALDCDAVTTSAYSLIPGTDIPVSIAGLVWAAVSGALALLAWRGRVLSGLSAAQVTWGGAGMLAVLYLVYGELVVVHRICEWCTAVHVLVLVSLIVAVERLTDL